MVVETDVIPSNVMNIGKHGGDNATGHHCQDLTLLHDRLSLEIKNAFVYPREVNFDLDPSLHRAPMKDRKEIFLLLYYILFLF